MVAAKLFAITLILQNAFTSADGVRCFECQNYPSPSLCSDVTTCASGDSCYVEEYITTSGHVVYNSGCMTQSRCLSSGTQFGRRQTDLLVCSECCQGELCNNEGCNKKAIPRDQRGPYCYACDFMTDPAGCDKVTVCAKDQQCSLYVPKEFHLYPTLLYSAGCQTNESCKTVATTYTHALCPAACCADDFCNTACGTPPTVTSSVSTSTATTPSTTPPTTPPTTPIKATPSTTLSTPISTISMPGSAPSTGTTAMPTAAPTAAPITAVPTAAPVPSQPGCPNHFIHVPSANSNGMCIQVGQFEVTWINARRRCLNKNADLLVLDTHEKIQALREYIKQHDHGIHGENFWIGANNVNNQFQWVNNQPLTHWDGAGPRVPHPDHEENCVLMNRHEDLRWNHVKCDHHRTVYFCEKPVIFTVATPTNTPSISNTPSITSGTQCGTGGYVTVPGPNTNRLCVRIGHSDIFNWNEARAVCLKEHADLVILDTQEKIHSLRDYLHHHHEIHGEKFWIGAYSMHDQHDLTWVNGQHVDHYQGDPHAGGHENHCVFMERHGESHWKTVKCDEHQVLFICERK